MSSQSEKKSHSQVILVGNVSSGKSSLLEFLENNFPTKVMYADELYKSNPFFQGDKFSDSKRWSFTSNVWFLTKKIELMADLPDLLENSSVVIDSGLVMSYVYAYFCLLMEFFEKDEFDLYLELFQKLTVSIPKPDLIVRLDAPPIVLRKRINERGRQYEIDTYDEKYLRTLDEAIRKTLIAFSKQGVSSITIPSSDINFLKPEGAWLDLFSNHLRK